MVWGTIGPIHKQGTKGVLREEMAVTEKTKSDFFTPVFTVRNLESFPQQNTSLWGSSEDLFQAEVSVEEVWNK